MSQVLTLPARLDVSGASLIVQDLRDANGPIQIKGQDVTHFGALALQALVAASRAAKLREDTFELTDCSDKMLSQMATMGVTPEELMEGKL